MAREDHAEVEREGFRVPLIGIRPSEMQDECDLCHHIFNIRQLEWTGTQLLCAKCRNEH